MFAAKQKLQGAVGGAGGEETHETPKTDKMRKELEARRASRGDDYATRMAERKANKGKISQMWAENKAKNKS
jgi:hypothetical protein